MPPPLFVGLGRFGWLSYLTADQLRGIVSRPICDRSGSGYLCRGQWTVNCTLVHFPELWPTFEKSCALSKSDARECRNMCRVPGRFGWLSYLTADHFRGIVSRSLNDRSGTGLSRKCQGAVDCTLVHFPQLWPTSQKGCSPSKSDKNKCLSVYPRCATASFRRTSTFPAACRT